MAITTKDPKDIVVSYITDYAKYVATSRAVPALLDGFKPVQRRIMASARDLGLWSNRSTLKSAKLAGEVLGNYHPHGDAYGPVAGLLQPFKIRYPLFEGQGKWRWARLPGSVAAPRYTELRFTKFAEDFYIKDAEYGDYEANYDGRLQELVMMYPVLPGCLLTGASGIAVGFSTSLPTSTITDISTSLLSYIDNPGTTDYLDLILPETMEESIIVTPKADIRKLYEKGNGSIRYKAKTHYEVIDGKSALVVDAFPPDFSKKSLQTAFILDAVEKGKLEVLNESKVNIRYVFISDDKEVLDHIESRLYKSVSYRMYIDHRGVIKMYTLGEIYETFVAEREQFVVRKYTDLLAKSKYELDYLNVLYLLKQDKNYIKDMFDKTSDVVIKEIMAMYSTTDKIASRVISTSLRSLMADNLAEILANIQKRTDEVAEYTGYINNPLSKVRMDIEEIAQKYSTEQRRAIHDLDNSSVKDITFKGQKMVVSESEQFVIGTTSNEIRVVMGAELIHRSTLDDIVDILPADKEFYVAYDCRGLTGMERDVLINSGNKFKSDSLKGIIGVQDLTTIELTLGNGKTQKLGDWCLRKRAAWQRMAEDDQPCISLEVK